MGVGAFFNRALFNLFFNPDKGSGRRIEGNDFLGVVESIEDLENNKPHVRTFEFGPGDVNEMIALIADAEEWRLSLCRESSSRQGWGQSRGCGSAYLCRGGQGVDGTGHRQPVPK